MEVSKELREMFVRQGFAYRLARDTIVVSRDVTFPSGSVVYVDSAGQFTGYGIVRDVEGCWPDHVATLVESGNTWYYPVEKITEHHIHCRDWPSWIAKLKRSQAASKGARTRRDNERRLQHLERP